MSRKRISERCPESSFYGIGFIENWEIVFNKKVSNGLAAANIKRKQGSKVWGVIFSISKDDLSKLDKREGYIEGLNFEEQEHYDRQLSTVTLTDLSTRAWLYLSPHDHSDLQIAKSYMEFLIDGATEYQLPEYYLNFLKAMPSV